MLRILSIIFLNFYYNKYDIKTFIYTLIQIFIKNKNLKIKDNNENNIYIYIFQIFSKIPYLYFFIKRIK